MAAVALGLVAGCDRQEIRTYRIAKETASPPPETRAPQNPASPRLRWETPPGWKEQPPSSLRVGHFIVPGPSNQQAQVTIVPLGGQAGGDLENVNRWRAQVGQPRLPETEIRALAEPVQIAGAPGRLFDIVGSPTGQDPPVRLLAAVLDRHDTAWFFKMIGSAPWVAAQKPVLIEFLRGVRFEPAP